MRLIEILRNPVAAVQMMGLYRGVTWGIAGVALWDGSLYFVKGNSVAQSGSFNVLREVPFFGMHFHGAIMLILAGVLFYQSHDGGKLSRGVFLFILGYSTWIAVAIMYSWYQTSEVTWSAPSKWFLVFWLNLLLAPAGNGSQRPERG